MSLDSSRPAYRIDGRSVPREAFYAAACDPSRSVVVEACAGAGKTWMLVSRVLRALLAGAEPSEILAITFTRKAAGEMRARLDEWLSEFAAFSAERRVDELRARGLDEVHAQALAPALGELHERILRGGRPVEIRTFHAWFAQLLRAAPLELLAELSLQPDMDLVEDPTEHAPEVYRRFHAAVLADPLLSADFETLVRERGRTQVRKWLDAAWNKRVEIELADAAGTLADSVASAHATWPQRGGPAHPTEWLASSSAHAMLVQLASALLQQADAVCRKQGRLLELALEVDDLAPRFDAVRAALLTRKGELRKRLDATGLQDAVALLDEVERACAQQAAHEEHGRMVRLARALSVEYAAYKRARGLADMADLERGALALLRDATLAGWVQERLDSRIRQVLIDEFQDTSPLQWHALHAWLSAYAGAGGGASGQRPPSVFIVGDPKQSIYRFRGAEPRVFDAAREFVVHGLEGSALACDHTRRNAPAVLRSINDVFAAAQAGGEFSGFRAHTTEVAELPGAGVYALPPVARPPKTSGEDTADASWRDSLQTPRHEADEVLREKEARQVARAVHELVARQGIAPRDIMLLCRKRESLRLVADALAAVHLPFAAAEDFSLLESPEVRDLVAVLDVLASPQHKLSLAQTLRSPLFDAADDDLISIAGATAPHGDWWRALMSLPDPSPVLQRARQLLARWQVAARQLPPHDLLDLIVAEGEVRERVAAAVPAERRVAALGAIDALLGQALTLDGARYATPYNFVRALKRRAIKVPAAIQRDAVRLLTVHGAKGLQARVVFVLDSDPEPLSAETASVLVDWPVESEVPARCAFVYAESQCPPSLTQVLERELAARQREELNGLYVAMSRARERVIFSATEPHRRAATASWWQRVAAHATAWAGQTSDADERVASRSDVSVRSLPPWSGGLRRAATSAPTDAEASRLGQAVHRVLQWAAAPGRRPVDLAPLANAAAREFSVDAAAVARLAERIWRSPAAARFLDPKKLRWAGNEVPVVDAGEVLRIDRLVAIDEAGESTWWVLDYKLQHAPQELAAYREQMLRYRAAVQFLQPGERVRCAFITGAGELVEVE